MNFKPIIIMTPLTLIRKKTKAGYVFRSSQQNVNSLLLMDGFKLYGEHEFQVSSLLDSMYAFSVDMIMKCGVLNIAWHVKNFRESLLLEVRRPGRMQM